MMDGNKDLPKLSRSVLNIPGTKPNVQSSQLLISSGIPSLDEIVGGGLPVGTVMLVEEDQHGTYAKIMLKYFLAEGLVSKHSVFVASQDISTEKIIKELPAVSVTDPEPAKNVPLNEEQMKIAFRYKNLPTAEKQRALEFGHHYDLTKTMPSDIIDQSDILHWKCKEARAPGTFSNPSYHHLLEDIRNNIKHGKFGVADKPEKRSVLRIGIHALGSPMWLFNEDLSSVAISQRRDLDMFIFCLRALVRSAFATAVVTIPSYLIDKNSLNRCIYSSDVAVRLQAFAGTPLEDNPVLSDYNGYFYIAKVAAINTFVSKHPGSVEYTFKLRRKKFCIEKLHLPPDLEISNKNEAPAMGCGSSNKHLLEF